MICNPNTRSEQVFSGERVCTFLLQFHIAGPSYSPHVCCSLWGLNCRLTFFNRVSFEEKSKTSSSSSVLAEKRATSRSVLDGSENAGFASGIMKLARRFLKILRVSEKLLPVVTVLGFPETCSNSRFSSFQKPGIHLLLSDSLKQTVIKKFFLHGNISKIGFVRRFGHMIRFVGL